MKIVYYTQTYFLDSDLPLVKKLIEKGNDVYLFIQLMPNTLKSTLVNIDIQLPKIDILPVSLYPQFNEYGDFFDKDKTFIINRSCKVYNLKNMLLRIRFHKILCCICPDIVLVTEFPKVQDFFLYQFRKNLVQIVHDPTPHTGETTFRKRFNKWISHHLCNCFVVLSESLKNKYVSSYHLQNKLVEVNRLGVYECLWHVKPETIQKYGKKQILFFGRISPYKGIEYLIKAMDIVHRRIPDAILIIAGGGELYFRKSLYEGKDYIKIFNRFLSLEELYGLLKISDITVCPYTDATQSGVIMTSYAACVPVVATRVGGLPEMILEGKTGELVTPKNTEELARNILYMIESDVRLNKYKANVKEAVNKGKYSWEVISDKYLEIFRKVLKLQS